MNIKSLLSLSLVALAGTAFADIQDPPMNDQGPTRKLSRGISNVLWGGTEFFTSMQQANHRAGNASEWSYGLVRGVSRTVSRMGAGVYEIFTFPFPTTKLSYRQPYKSNIPWINSGYEEFPPELGWNTRRRYNTSSYAGW
jgi:putative exosortase-associated protein (TIGR04073 family)